MGIVVIGTVFVDIKGFPEDVYIPNGRNAGRIEYVHGGVARNVVEDIANLELRPTFVGTVDSTSMGKDVVEKLVRHKVNVDYVKAVPDGMGTWLALFNEDGDVAGQISKRPNTYLPMLILEKHGDEIVKDCDSIIFELDLHKDVVKKIFELAEKYHKKVYALVSNMSTPCHPQPTEYYYPHSPQYINHRHRSCAIHAYTGNHWSAAHALPHHH